jgi:hypothetical protein
MLRGTTATPTNVEESQYAKSFRARNIDHNPSRLPRRTYTRQNFKEPQGSATQREYIHPAVVDFVAVAASDAPRKTKKDGAPETREPGAIPKGLVVSSFEVCKVLKLLVGERGFEPPTPWSRTSFSMLSKSVEIA